MVDWKLVKELRSIYKDSAASTGLSSGSGSPHYHASTEVTGLAASLDNKAPVIHSHDTTHNHDADYAATGHTHSSGAKAVYLPLLTHFTTLEETTSANATWKIPAVATYGQSAVVRIDMSKLGTPTSGEFFVLYTNTATTGTNQIGLRLGTPVAAGTTVTPVTSSITTLANSSTYPQVINKALTVSELGSIATYAQLTLNLASSAVGPNIYTAALILYY